MRHSVFDYIAISQAFAERYTGRDINTVLATYLYCINAVNIKKWPKYFSVDLPDLCKKISRCERTARRCLDFLCSEDGIMEKVHFNRSNHALAFRMKQKDELRWVKFKNNLYDVLEYSDTVVVFSNKNAEKDYQNIFIKNEQVLEQESEIIPELKKEEKPVRKSATKTEKPAIVSDGDVAEEFTFTEMLTFANRNYNSQNPDFKKIWSQDKFDGYQKFVRGIATRHFSNPKFKNNVTPAQYLKHLYGHTDEELEETIKKVNSSTGFKGEVAIALRISWAFTWKNNSANNDDAVMLDGKRYNMSTRYIEFIKPEERNNVKRAMYNFIKECSVDRIEEARLAKKILESYKINGDTRIDESTADHTGNMIASLEGKFITKTFIQTNFTKRPKMLEESIVVIIKNIDVCQSYYKYCYAAFINNKQEIVFSFQPIITEVSIRENLNDMNTFGTTLIQIIDTYIEKTMKVEMYPQNKLYQYNTDEIKKEEEFNLVWAEHTKTVDKNSTKFELTTPIQLT